MSIANFSLVTRIEAKIVRDFAKHEHVRVLIVEDDRNAGVGVRELHRRRASDVRPQVQSPAVSRDPWKLKVFALADEVVVDVYRATRRFPMEQRRV